MGYDPAEKEALERELLRRLDPGGEMGQLLRAFDSGLGPGHWRALGILAGTDIEALVIQVKNLFSTTAGAILAFAPLGWAPTLRNPTDVYARAWRAYEQTGSTEEVERELLDGWNRGDALRFAVLPISVLGAGDDRYRPIAEERWRLTQKALAHHQAGNYDASVPLVLAQVEGIVQDLTGEGFFSRKPSARGVLADDQTLLGIDAESLRKLRALFTEGMDESGATGSLSRHGILHGRELRYDTLLNSTKAFVLLSSIVQWADPKADERAEQRRRELEELHAGAGEVDENGRQLDRRGFLHIKNWLDDVVAWKQCEAWGREGRYFDELDRAPLPPVPSFVSEHPVARHLEVSEDGREYRAWGVAPSGFCLGIADRDGEAAVWHYAATCPPSGGIGADPDWRHVARDPGHVDW